MMLTILFLRVEFEPGKLEELDMAIWTGNAISHKL
jgi:hypothetical protein